MKKFFKRLKEKFLIEWRKYQRIQSTKRCGFDPYVVFDALRDIETENVRLKNEIATLRSNQAHSMANKVLEDENEELKSQVQKFANMHNEFPVVLRKMWSGGQVVTWIRKKQYEYLVDKED